MRSHRLEKAVGGVHVAVGVSFALLMLMSAGGCQLFPPVADAPSQDAGFPFLVPDAAINFNGGRIGKELTWLKFEVVEDKQVTVLLADLETQLREGGWIRVQRSWFGKWRSVDVKTGSGFERVDRFTDAWEAENGAIFSYDVDDLQGDSPTLVKQLLSEGHEAARFLEVTSAAERRIQLAGMVQKENSIEVGLGRFFVVEDAGRSCAVKLHSSDEPWTVHYEAYAGLSGNGTVEFSSAERFLGSVSESQRDGVVIPESSKLIIGCGSIEVEWSWPDHLYCVGLLTGATVQSLRGTSAERLEEIRECAPSKVLHCPTG